MDRFKVRFTPEAEDDLLTKMGIAAGTVPPGFALLNAGLRNRDATAAEHALEAITRAVELLRFSPFSCRKALPDNPFIRELVIPFGSAGYVALFEIESKRTISIVAVRHQREEDYR